jgi:hypothetical protein
MSLHIIVLDAEKKKIHAISDKRVGKGYCKDGVMVRWERVDDNSMKLQPITNEVYLTGGNTVEISERFYEHLLTVKDKKPSEIIKFATQFDREIKPQFWNDKFDPALIFGIYDDGRIFIWTGDREGGNELTFLRENTIIDMGGGKKENSPKIKKFISDYMVNSRDYPAILRAALSYASSIDEWISSTYDFITITAPSSSNS